MNSILDDMNEFNFIFLGVIMVLWLYRRMSLFKDVLEEFRSESPAIIICNLFSNDSPRK